VNRGSTVVLVGACAGLFLAGACKPPTIATLDPPQGPPHTVVQVQGANLALGRVIWDRGLASEVAVPTSLSGSLFSVPPGAAAGPHPVAVQTGVGTSGTLSFTVTAAPVAFPAPRIDDVYVQLFSINASGATFLLFAYGPNVDAGAKVVVDGVEQTSAFSQVLRATLPGAAGTLGYPIFHYGMIWCGLVNQPPGTTINVAVKNLDGQLSATVPYRIAANMAELDSDNDGLSDQIEDHGFDANGDGMIDVDLPAMGVNKWHKDVLVEADWMTGAAAPLAAVWPTAVAAMANYPVMNLDGVQGLNLIVDRGQGAPFTGGGTNPPTTDCMRLGGGTATGFTDQYAFKATAANFDPNRLRLFHYVIFGFDSAACAIGCGTAGGVTNSGCSSGQSESFLGPGNDFYVTCPSNLCSATSQAATFLHELGHNLALQHGGDEGTNFKPNYPSIMSYRYQFPGVSTNCDLTPDGVLTYSQGMLSNLDENNLNENLGICGNVSIDWNGSGALQTGVSTDINSDGALSVLHDSADFKRVQLRFATAAGTQWGGN